MSRLALHWQVLIALGLAVVAGLLSGPDAGFFGIRFYDIFNFIGTLFMNALKMIIVPLIMSSIITGISGLGATRGLARLGGKTLAFYFTTTFCAILIGLFMVNLLTPGLVEGEPGREIFGLDETGLAEASEKIAGRDAGSIAEVFLRLVPANIVSAAANGQMLGLIFFSLLFGYFMGRLPPTQSAAQQQFWQGVMDIMMRITEWVMRFAPLGVFALVAKVIAGLEHDGILDLAQALGVFFLTVVLALLLHFALVLPALLRFIARVNPLLHYKAMLPALLTAFSTASSSATLPLTMDCVEKNAGVSNRTSSFVLPLGATVNMDGTALYECVAAMFIAQAYGLELDFTTQFIIVLVALLTSIGVAGIPAASLVAITIILGTIGLPLEALGLILAVDRILDMFRTAVNVFSDSVAAVVVARLEGETGLYRTEAQA